MKLVIDIHEKDYQSILNSGQVPYSVVYAIMNGTPLPKGHGRLIECERLQEVFRRNVVGYAGFKQLFDIAPTIIESDGGGEE